MEVSRFKRVRFEYMLKKRNNEIESDYIALGKRSDKCYVRFYLKSKEVCEMQYKDFFLSIWLFNNLINRYDFYVLSETYKTGNWKHLDVNRLKFYVEYGSDLFVKAICSKLLSSDEFNYDAISELADLITPQVTKILNVEFQTTRKSSKSYKLFKVRDNSKYGVASRIYDYLDNRKLITDYLTHSTLRLVRSDNAEKVRCSYVDFWERLRNTKQVDVSLNTHQLKLTRDYSRELNKDVIKIRMCNALVNFSIYTKGINDDDITNDIIGSMVRLNDNDIERMKGYKRKRNLLLKNEDFSKTQDNININAHFIDEDTGEVIW